MKKENDFNVLRKQYLKVLVEIERLESEKLSIARSLGRSIAYVRECNNMSLKNISERLGVSRMYIHDMENGRRFPSLDLIKLFESLCPPPPAKN